MCVVPGDIWTCDTLLTEQPAIVTKRYQTPETINLADSYLGYTPNPLEFSEPIDSSYTIDDDVSELTTEAATAYPLIEFEESHSGTPHGDGHARNVSYHKEENYSFVYTHNHLWVPLPVMQRYTDMVNSHNKWLSELMSRLHVYKELSTAISDSAVPIREATTVSSTRTIAVFASHKQKQNVSVEHFVHGYTGQTQPHDDKPSELEENDEPPMENTLQQLINDLDPDNNVIRISDDFENHRYLTIEAYKAAAHNFTPRFVSVLACTRNVRLPNRTDCARYYMCNPRTASVTDYSCPLHTAFNMNSRICDVESAKACNTGKPSTIFVDRVERRNTTMRDEKPCRELGKVKDPTSDSHYYICYGTSGPEDVKSIRMTCPNALIFCQHKKVCTTKRLCDTS